MIVFYFTPPFAVFFGIGIINNIFHVVDFSSFFPRRKFNEQKIIDFRYSAPLLGYLS